jgi:hypothetical protein
MRHLFLELDKTRDLHSTAVLDDRTNHQIVFVSSFTRRPIVAPVCNHWYIVCSSPRNFDYCATVRRLLVEASNQEPSVILNVCKMFCTELQRSIRGGELGIRLKHRFAPRIKDLDIRLKHREQCSVIPSSSGFRESIRTSYIRWYFPLHFNHTPNVLAVASIKLYTITWMDT